MKANILLLTGSLFVVLACTKGKSPAPKSGPAPVLQPVNEKKIASLPKKASAAEIIARKEVPILCYHQIKAEGPGVKFGDYSVSIAAFRSQVKMLRDSGYHSVLPEDLYDYLAYGKALPEKPVMFTFDDTRLEHYTIAADELEKNGFRGAFFIMTIAIGKKNYMSPEQIRGLAEKGHSVGLHTWDHHNVKTLKDDKAWEEQIDRPKKKLENILGRKVEYFAYPFGEWNQPAIPELKQRDLKAAFQLAAKRDPADPLYTIRRIIVPPTWSNERLLKSMKHSF